MQNLSIKTKKILGVSAGFHDAALTVLHDSEIVFAAHSERYSKKKNDSTICEALQRAALEYGPFDEIVYYEKPWKRQLRKLRSGEPWGGNWLLMSELKDTIPLIMNSHQKKVSTKLLQESFDLFANDLFKPVSSVGHHLAHAAAGFQTSPFKQAAVVVIDAIGEMDTISIYKADYGTTPSYMGCKQRKKARYKRVYRQTYPHSIGMFYSAVTKRVGLRPMDEEYITMGMAAYGTGSKAIGTLVDNLVYDIPTATFSRNMHVGIDDLEFASDVDEMDIAAAGQQLCEELITGVMRTARELTGSRNLVYMGGVALNCVANSKLQCGCHSCGVNSDNLVGGTCSRDTRMLPICCSCSNSSRAAWCSVIKRLINQRNPFVFCKCSCICKIKCCDTSYLTRSCVSDFVC